MTFLRYPILCAMFALFSFDVSSALAQNEIPASDSASAKPPSKPKPIFPSSRFLKGAKPITLVGKVVDAQGKAVSGAKLFVASRSVDAEPMSTADEHGQFNFEVPLNEIDLSALKLWGESPNGSQMGFCAFPHGQGPVHSGMEIKIEPISYATVQVVDADGKPIQDANVVLNLTNGNSIGVMTTDASGLASHAVPQSDVISEAVAWKDGAGLDYRIYKYMDRGKFRSNPKSPAFPADASEVLTLRGARPLKIHVQDEDGKPIQDVHTYMPWLANKDYDRTLNLDYYQGYLATLTDSAGNTSFDWFPEWQQDETSVVARKFPPIGYTESDEVHSIASGHAEITLNRLIPIRGTLSLPDGAPAADVDLLAKGVSYNPNAAFTGGKTNAEGKYEIFVPPNRVYSLEVRNNKWAAASVQEPFVVLPSQEAVVRDIKLRPATRVYGNLVSTFDQAPEPGTEIQLYRDDIDWKKLVKDAIPNPRSERLWMMPSYEAQTRTDANGAFEFFVGDGEYELMASGFGHSRFKVNQESELQVNIESRFNMITLSGQTLEESSNRPIKNITIYSFQKYVVASHMERTKSDEDGNFEYKRQAEKEIVTALSDDKRLGAITELSPTDKKVTMRLVPTGTAKGRLVAKDGTTPVTNQSMRYGICVTDPKFPHIPSHWDYTVSTDADGKFTLTGLVPDWKYACHVCPKGHMYEIEGLQVMVTAGQSIDLGDVMVPAKMQTP